MAKAITQAAGKARKAAAAASAAPAGAAPASAAAASGRGPSARERLLAAANELFYAEGIHTVGIDRVIERAGVAKASLYATFRSKEELVRAYLEGRAEARRQRIEDRIAKHYQPRDKIIAIFELLADLAAQPSFRGCAFVNACAEGPREGGVTEVSEDMRSWTRALFVDLARKYGASDPVELGRQLQLLYDGAIVSASMDRDRSAPLAAGAMAGALLDASKKARR